MAATKQRLRERMREDLELRGMSANTITTYLRSRARSRPAGKSTSVTWTFAHSAASLSDRMRVSKVLISEVEHFLR